MRILVIDDNPINLKAAEQTLKGHDLVVADNYDAAVKFLDRAEDYDGVREELKRRGLSVVGLDFKDPERLRIENIKRELLEQSRPAPFDVVLTDLLMPPGDEKVNYCGQENLKKQLMPVGFALALHAVLHGAKYAAVVTATNHHDHPASAMIDRLGTAYWEDREKNSWRGDRKKSRAKFLINGARVGFFHHPACFVEGTTCEACSGNFPPCGHCEGTGQGKKWLDDVKRYGLETCTLCNGVGNYCTTCKNTGFKEGKDWGRVLTRLLEADNQGSSAPAVSDEK